MQVVAALFLVPALALLTYGLAAYVVARSVAAGSKRGPGTVLFLVVALLAVAIPCFKASQWIASLLPISWGHLGELFFVPYFLCAFAIFGFTAASYGRQLGR